MSPSTSDVTCTACGCLCDDISVESDGKLVNACRHGAEWFDADRRFTPLAPAIVDGQNANLDDAISAAAKLLADARLPLIFGLQEFDVHGQRAVIALADCIGACVDTDCVSDNFTINWPGLGAFGCTWGEVIDRADLIIYCKCDLSKSWWRHQERVLDRIRRLRPLAVLSVQYEINDIWLLRALVQGRRVPAPSRLRDVATRLQQANYAVVVHHGDSRLVAALQALTHDVNLTVRCRTIDLGSPHNAAGQTQVIQWQTGYSRAVGLHRGFPVSYSTEFSATELLNRHHPDVALSGGATVEALPATARDYLQSIPHIVVTSKEVPRIGSPSLTLFSSTPGINSSGVVFRSDGLTLPLRPAFSPSRPPAFLVINRLTDAMRLARN